jgi:hypothetical protein
MSGKHGGKRPGAGRPASPDSRSIPKSIKVTQEMAEYLAEHGTGLIEDAIRRTLQFKEWRRKKKDQSS